MIFHKASPLAACGFQWKLHQSNGWVNSQSWKCADDHMLGKNNPQQSLEHSPSCSQLIAEAFHPSKCKSKQQTHSFQTWIVTNRLSQHPNLLCKRRVVAAVCMFTFSTGKMCLNRVWVSCKLPCFPRGLWFQGLYGYWLAHCNKSPSWGLIGTSKAPSAL